MPSKIQWTDEVWNVTSGCRRVSEGCRNCYAERMARRLKGMGVPQYQSVVDEHGWTGNTTMNVDILTRPYHWKKPRRIFVDSMADLFFADRNGFNLTFYAALFSVMLQTPRHTYLLLTKRPGNAQVVLEAVKRTLGEELMSPFPWPLPNVGVGISAENQETANLRIPKLLPIPAAFHFVSLEPLLGPIDITGKSVDSYWINDVADPLIDEEVNMLDWIITGCESGPGRRPANIEWFRSLRDQCQRAGVAFFLKQMDKRGKIVHMPKLDGIVYDQFPENIE